MLATCRRFGSQHCGFFLHSNLSCLWWQPFPQRLFLQSQWPAKGRVLLVADSLCGKNQRLFRWCNAQHSSDCAHWIGLRQQDAACLRENRMKNITIFFWIKRSWIDELVVLHGKSWYKMVLYGLAWNWTPAPVVATVVLKAIGQFLTQGMLSTSTCNFISRLLLIIIYHLMSCQVLSQVADMMVENIIYWYISIYYIYIQWYHGSFQRTWLSSLQQLHNLILCS